MTKGDFGGVTRECGGGWWCRGQDGFVEAPSAPQTCQRDFNLIKTHDTTENNTDIKEQYSTSGSVDGALLASSERGDAGGVSLTTSMYETTSEFGLNCDFRRAL